MAKFRQLDCGFWNNKYVASLSSETRYIYLYLKLNPHLNTAGFAKLPVELMSLECGVDIPSLRQALAKLEADDKIKYQEGYLILREGHDGQTTSVKVKSAIDTQIADAPAWIGEYIMRGKQNDERASHPAIVAVREITEKFPPKKDWDLLIEIIGEDPDIDLLVDAHSEWARRGYSPFNFSWITDWYANKRIPYKTGGRPTNSDTLASYRDVFSS